VVVNRKKKTICVNLSYARMASVESSERTIGRSDDELDLAHRSELDRVVHEVEHHLR
jgi:hypothetical protein